MEETKDMDQDINIEEILREIRKEIKEKGYTNDLLSFEDVESAEVMPTDLDSCLEELEDASLIETSWPILYENGVKNKTKVIMKKIIRKLVKFYFDHTFSLQNRYNELNVMTLMMLYDKLNEQQDELRALKKEIEFMKEKLAERDDKE